MDIMELIRSRHSVRKYLSKPIESGKRNELDQYAKACSEESGLRFLMVYDEPKCFGTLFSRVARFKGCENYIVIVGKANDTEMNEKAGYFGEKLVLKAQELGLNTCWVALTCGKTAVNLAADEKQIIVIALGYGENQGVPHKSKPVSAVSNVTENLPEWYARGLEAALLAPTAVNQQKFYITLDGDCAKITAEDKALVRLDLGIVKCHFELASGHCCE